MLNRIMLLAGLIIATAGTAHAAGIAVLDAQQVVNGTNAAKRAIESLKDKRDDAQNRINKLEKPLIDKRRKLEDQRSVLSNEQFLEKQSELRKELVQFRAEAQAIQEELDRENLKLRKKITDAMRKVVAEMAKKNDYEIVLPKNVLFFADDSVDISEEVLKRVNAELD